MPKHTRDELLAFLARVVRDKVMTEADAVIVLQKFDNGTLPDRDLPIPPEQFIRGLTRADADEALK